MVKSFLEVSEIVESPQHPAYDPMGYACKLVHGKCDQDGNSLNLLPGTARFIPAESLGELASLEGFVAMEITPGGMIRLKFST